MAGGAGPKTLLVTGASGFLGWNLCPLAARSWRVVGVGHARPIAISGITTVSCDLTRYGELAALFDEVRPDAVIHAAAQAQPDTCQRDPEGSRRINVDAAVNIAGLAADAGIPYVFTSTDLVFDGRHSPYREEDPVGPVSIYGEQKVAAEEGIRARHPGCMICRMPLMFGEPAPGGRNFLQSCIAALAAGEPLRLFVDEIRSCISSRTGAAGLLLALGQGGGTLHLGGRARISRHELGSMLAELLGMGGDRIQAVRQADIPFIAPRPPDVSLDSGKAYALGYDPPPIREDLRQVLVALGHAPRGG